jgi:hypothetical protein
MYVQVLAPQASRWQEILAQLRHDVYHLPQYVVIEAQRSNTQTEAVLITQGDCLFFAPYLLRSCQDVIPSSGNEPFLYDVISPYGYSGFLLNEAALEHPDFAISAFHQFKEVLRSKQVCTAFLRLHPILNAQYPDRLISEPLIENGETVSINLKLSEAELWAHLRRGHQSTINKCKRLGQIVKVVPFRDYLEPFCEIYRETMDRVSAQDGYYFGRDYFHRLLELENNLYLAIVEADHQIASACLFFECCGIVQAHLGGTRTPFLKVSPFNLLLYSVALWAKVRGNEYLHLGGGVGGSNADPLYIFKSGFSRQRHPFFTARLVLDETQYQALIESRAATLGISPAQLLTSDFFPTYRAPVPSELLNAS